MNAGSDSTKIISTLDADVKDVLPAGFMDLYEVYSYRNAASILSNAYGDDFSQSLILLWLSESRPKKS
jgi:CRISPR-associated protein Csd2